MPQQDKPYWITVWEYEVQHAGTELERMLKPIETDFNHTGKLYKSIIGGSTYCIDKLYVASIEANFNDVWQWGNGTVQTGWSFRTERGTKQMDVYVYPFNPESVEIFCEKLIDFVYEQNLPLNPKQLYDIAQRNPHTAIDPNQIMVYMREEYGWNDNFYTEPIYSHSKK